MNLFTQQANLTEEQRAYFFMLNKVMEDLRDNYPDELAYALGDQVTNIDTATESASNLSGYYMKGLLESAMLDDGTIDYTVAEENSDSFLNNLSDVAITSAETKMSSIASTAQEFINSPQDFSGGGGSGRFSPSIDSFSNVGGEVRSCNVDDCPIHIYNPSASCYEFCQGASNEWSATYGCPPDEPYCNEEEGGGGLANFFNSLLNVAGNIAEEVGAENIWDTFFGSGDEGDTTNYYINEDGEEVTEEKPFNWLALGVGVIVTVAVVGGIIYFVRKSKAD